MTKNESLRIDDVARLLRLILEIADDEHCSPAEAIDRMAERLSAVVDQRPPRRSSLAQFVAGFRRIRLRRNELLGASLFRDPAWDMLLELYVAQERGRDLSVSSVCYAAGVPATTALRYLQRLEEHGLVERKGDRSDNRRLFVRPTEKAMRGIDAALTLLMEHFDRLGARTEEEAA